MRKIWKRDEDETISTGLNFENLRGMLLASPETVAARARARLAVQPDDPDARLLLGAILWRGRNADAAKEIIESIVRSNPDSAFARFELGHSLAQLGTHNEAADNFARAVDFMPAFAEGWYALGDELAKGTVDTDIGPDAPAWRVVAHQAEAALRDQSAEKAESFVEHLLGQHPGNAILLKFLADVALSEGRIAKCEDLLARCLEVAPAFRAARLRYVIVLLAQEKANSALSAARELLRREPSNACYRALNATAHFEAGEYDRAISLYEEILGDDPDRLGIWISLGRALRTIGREPECIAAFRRALQRMPGYAEAYRVLATIKTVRFEQEDIATLRDLLQRPGVLAAGRAQLHFALGKGLEDARQYDESFENYRQCNLLRQAGSRYSADTFTNLVRRATGLFTNEFFGQRSGFGCDAPDPIFIVGMPRAGSTLIQEILAAHSSVERMGELWDLSKVVGPVIDGPPGKSLRGFRDAVSDLDAAQCKLLGETYIRRVGTRKKSGAPFFVDKFPENFLHIGLIRLILPNAKIVDVRRNPLDCCLSCYKNYFPDAHPWAHSFDNLGRYYRDYVEMMSHFDDVLPGRIHRVIYERLIGNPEEEVSSLLSYLGLPFEQRCLRYFETRQPILTTSVEQARQPIYDSSVGNSRYFEPWLEPLKAALGPVLDLYPAAPKLFPRLGATIPLRIA
jgi:tetratricopeptide (TPR) repeat protein